MSKKIKISAPTNTLLTTPKVVDILICSFLQKGEIYNLTLTASKFLILLNEAQVLKTLYNQTYPQQLYVKPSFLPPAIKRRYNIDRNMKIGKKTVKQHYPMKSSISWGDPFFRSYRDKIIVYYDNSKYVQLLKNKPITVARVSEGITDLQFDDEKIVCCEYVNNKLTVFDWAGQITQTIIEQIPNVFKIDDNILYIGTELGELKVRDFRTKTLVDTLQIDNTEISGIVAHPAYVYLTSYTSKLVQIDRRMNMMAKTKMITPSDPLRFDGLCGTDDHLITADANPIASFLPTYYLIRIWDMELEVKDTIPVDHKVNISCDQHKLIYNHYLKNGQKLDHYVKIWSLDKNKKYQPFSKLKTNRPLNMLVNDDKIVVGLDRGMEVWQF
jgi:hypothetical protein